MCEGKPFQNRLWRLTKDETYLLVLTWAILVASEWMKVVHVPRIYGEYALGCADSLRRSTRIPRNLAITLTTTMIVVPLILAAKWRAGDDAMVRNRGDRFVPKGIHDDTIIVIVPCFVPRRVCWVLLWLNLGCRSLFFLLMYTPWD